MQPEINPQAEPEQQHDEARARKHRREDHAREYRRGRWFMAIAGVIAVVCGLTAVITSGFRLAARGGEPGDMVALVVSAVILTAAMLIVGGGWTSHALTYRHALDMDRAGHLVGSAAAEIFDLRMQLDAVRRGYEAAAPAHQIEPEKIRNRMAIAYVSQGGDINDSDTSVRYVAGFNGDTGQQDPTAGTFFHVHVPTGEAA
ncbi:hypothetical protein NQ036_03805 [Brevibacterium sp. 91QC2O2]|uniref:hypothetical protein n=1 Tax=Brevibacterium TaxID=1696 RepID=UPI00211CC1BE|nr:MULTISPECIES: hypothetical protein [unclassified Brevibacterium]MCQ9367372.1 hypothetical protein [Brevibacterium sp. 91QC2O2]MCQ9384615.1 hypothetical protein [Brevibacterium sp. 68QC2CO]